MQDVTGGSVELAYVDQGYIGEDVAAEAQAEGITLEVVKLSEAKRGFVLLPRRWVVERSIGWLRRFRRLAKDDERLPQTLAGLHFPDFACLLTKRPHRNRCRRFCASVYLVGDASNRSVLTL